MRGYAYDSFNPDALFRLATVRNGRVELPGGASYGVLVFPGAGKMDPDGHAISKELHAKLAQLTRQGATVVVNGITQYATDTGLYEKNRFASTAYYKTSLQQTEKTQGRLLLGPYTDSNFDKLGLPRDFTALNASGGREEGIAWTHRAAPGLDIYLYLTNRKYKEILCFPCAHRVACRSFGIR